MLTDRGALRHRFDHRPAEVLRVRAREADPFDPIDGVAGAQELAEVGLKRRQEITPVGVDVLAEQRDLTHPVAGKLLDLRKDLTGPPALLAPTNRRDDAVRALRVAAHRDLDPGLELALAVHRQTAREAAVIEPKAPPCDTGAPGTDPFAEVWDRSRAERDVHVRVELEQPLALRLGVAAAYCDHLLGIARLDRPRLGQASGEALVGLLADRAGVEDEDVSVALVRCLSEAQLLEHSLDSL